MKLYRVTEILEKYVNRDNIPDWRWDAAGDRGTRLHTCTANYLRGIWIPSVDLDVEPYFDSFVAWAQDMIEETFFVEKELKDSTYGFIGHADWIGILKPYLNSGAVVDWKSPVTEGNTWKAQVGAYFYLANQKELKLPVTMRKAGALMLNPKGKTAKFIDYSDERQQAFQIFLNALNSHRWLVG